MPADRSSPPVLFVDVDGVISLFGFPFDADPPGSYHYVDGIIHCLSGRAGELLVRLSERYELVWATGWEERANDYLPRLLGLASSQLPVVSFDGRATFGSAHWKLEALGEYAGDRPVAWIDDNLDERCERWASERPAPTLLVRTDPAVGIDEGHVERLLRFADEVAGDAQPPRS